MAISLRCVGTLVSWRLLWAEYSCVRLWCLHRVSFAPCSWTLVFYFWFEDTSFFASIVFFPCLFLFLCCKACAMFFSFAHCPMKPVPRAALDCRGLAVGLGPVFWILVIFLWSLAYFLTFFSCDLFFWSFLLLLRICGWCTAYVDPGLAWLTFEAQTSHTRVALPQVCGMRACLGQQLLRMISIFL